MAAVLLIACAAGAACGLAQLKVWIIIPASVIFLLAVTVLDFRFGIAWSRTALIAFAGLTLLQVSYLIGAAVSEVDTPSGVRSPAEAATKESAKKFIDKAFLGTVSEHDHKIIRGVLKDERR